MKTLSIKKKTLLVDTDGLPVEQAVHDIAVTPDRHYILDNGVVSHNSYVPTRAMSGGDGAVFAASVVLYLDNHRERDKKDSKEIAGNVITCILKKGRFTRDGKQVQIYLDHKRGCLKHYGLLEFGVRHGVFGRTEKKYIMPNADGSIPAKDGVEVYARQVYIDPEKYFLPEIMARLEAAAYKEFTFMGSQSSPPPEESGQFDEDFGAEETDKKKKKKR